jgi:two-component system response regulator RegX3
VARVKAVLRRGTESVGNSGDARILEVGQLKLDIDRHSITFNQENISLPLKEFELLEFLMRNAGRVLTRDQLIDRIWGSDYVGDTKTLDVHIKRLRSKFEKDPANPDLIQTVRGLGYKLEDK